MNKNINIYNSYKNVIGKKYLLIYAIYFTFFLFNGPLERLVSVLVISKGYSEVTFGVILSIINLIHIALPGIVGILASLNNSYVIAGIAMILAIISSIGIGIGINTSSYFFIFVVVLVCSRTIFNFSLGNTINYIVEEESRGKYFALRDFFLFGAISIGLILGSEYVNRFGIDSLYKYGGYFFLIPLIFIHRLYKHQKRLGTVTSKSDDVERDKIKYSKQLIFKLMKDKRFLSYLLIELCTSIYAVAINFLPIYGVKLGVSVSEIMTLFGSITIVNCILGIFIGHFSDISGRKWYYVFDLAVDSIPAVIFALTNNKMIFIIAIILTMIKDMFAPISLAYFYDCFSDEDGTIVLGVVSSVSNILSLVLPVGVSILWAYSTRIVFLIGAGGSIMAGIIAALMLPNVKEEGEKSN